MPSTVRWGIIGPGKIARKFAAGFEKVPHARLHAIASRDLSRGKEFAKEFNVPVCYDSYAALIADPEIDIIYIATPHAFHHPQTLQCLRGKKAVLCEKPLTLDFRKASELVATARANDTFLMEGMWSRFFPAIRKTVELVRSGAIGEIRFMRADFGFSAPHDPNNRVLNLALGGGAQLDVGVYPMFLVLLLMGKPTQVQATARLAATGADETTAVQFCFQDGGIAHILSSIAADTPKQADIIGTSGTLTLHTPWHKSEKLTLKHPDGKTDVFDFPFTGFGFDYEVAEVSSTILAGKKESDLLPLDFSLLMAEVADEILKQSHVVYPAI